MGLETPSSVGPGGVSSSAVLSVKYSQSFRLGFYPALSLEGVTEPKKERFREHTNREENGIERDL